MKKISWFKKSILVFASIVALGAGIYYVYTPQGPIYEYSEERDTQDILKLFRENWYWLTSNADYSPEFMLKYRTDKQNPLYFGKLKIKVLRDDNKFIGFTAYFMDSKDVGVIRFIGVREEMRGKGYAQRLMQYALDDLKNMGAKRINLVTRTANYSAQKLYERTGFKETLRDEDGFVYYAYYVK